VLTSLQYIEGDGTKRYHAGGATGGSFWVIGDIAAASSLSSSSSRIFVAEGFATAATIHEATGDPCIVAFSASNLVQVTGTMRKTTTGTDIVIVADNDASGIGRKYADQASAKHGARVITHQSKGMRTIIWQMDMIWSRC
jgi:putative DNA primase/helicase